MRLRLQIAGAPLAMLLLAASTAVAQTAPPAAPVGLSCVAAGSSVLRLHWTPPAGVYSCIPAFSSCYPILHLLLS